MTVSFFHPSPANDPKGRTVGGAPDDLLEMLGPVMAGSRARGVADAFELLGIPAVLIDGTGEVLHCSPGAERLLSPVARIVGRHLLGTDASTKDLIESFVSRIVGTQSLQSDAVEFGGDGESPCVRLRALRFPASEPDAVQLLHTILVVEAAA